MLQILFACFALVQVSGAAAAGPGWVPFDTSQYKRHATILTPAKKPVEFYWTLSSDLATINIGVASNNSAGWLAVGFSETGGMKGADIALGYVNATSSKFVLEDRFAEDFAKPALDAHQDITLTGSWSTPTYTAFTFTRPTKASCNNTEDIDLRVGPNSIQNVLVAFGTSMNFAQHTSTDRGSTRIDLNSATNEAAALLESPPISDTDLITFDLLSPNTSVPAEITSYCYSYFEAPTDAKYHVVQEIPIIRDPRIHHLVIYVCDSPLTAYFNSTTPKVQCGDFGFCYRFFSEWAPGQNIRTYSQDFAKPVGLGEASAKYFLLEIHYNQVNPTSFIESGSGYQLKLSKNLRKNDLGVLVIGMDPNYIFDIPAGEITSRTYEFPQGCSRLLPQNLTVVGTGLHMHKRGRAAKASIIRQGSNQTETLLGQDYFDFNYHVYNRINYVNIAPGDRLLMNCIWDSTNERNSTKGGFSSTEEMCYAFIDYYPVQPLISGWRLPFIMNSTLDVVNVTDPFGGNTEFCIKGTPDASSFIPAVAFVPPKPELLTCAPSSAIRSVPLNSGFVVALMVLFSFTLLL
ncbi:PHM/PNGase F domain-containing protein [Cladochytrium replicatum]|nr:PHM/PNGase F domain-containing protein [Cladochytrium replicatum]